MLRPTSRTIPLVAVLLSALIAGCSTTKPSRFYTLSSPSELGVGATTTMQTEYGAIGLGPVSIPQYLDRPQIVTIEGPNRYELAEFDRWGGALRDNLSRTLAEDLTRLIPSARISTHPWRRATPVDYQIPIDVIRFDGALGKEVVFIAQWQVLSANGSTQLLSRRSSFTEAVNGTSYDDMVAAQSRTVADLAREIASALKTVKRETPEH